MANPIIHGYRRLAVALAATTSLALSACSQDTPPTDEPARYDVIVRGGLVYDGSGNAPVLTDIAINGETVAAMGALTDATATTEIDATGMAVAPGFINVLSWAIDSLIEDGRSQGDIRQGVTLEVFGEGWSMGPINEAMRAGLIEQQGDIQYDVTWTTLGEYLEHLVELGVSPNVASFVGADTVRVHELGYEDRPPNPEELARMEELVREAMREGALGVGSSLIYAPAFYADTDELVSLASAAAEFGGGYITHARSEGNGFLEGIDEAIEIARRADTWAQIYHLKPAGAANWDQRDAGIARLEAARAEGLDLTADMYLYTAGMTGLDASIPPWAHEGGQDALIARLTDPEARARIIEAIRTPSDEWENLFLASGGADNVLLVGFRNEALRHYTGMTLTDIAAQRGVSPEEAIVDLVVEDNSRIGTVYFIMSEDNVRANITWPWMMFGSDGSSMATEGVFLNSNEHPRAYGNFARLLGRYVREQQVITLEEAIRRLTRLTAAQLRLTDRGCIDPGCYADVVIFDPETIIDHATYAEPHQYATGMRDVFVNGIAVLRDGEHTDARPGQVVRGPGFVGDEE